MTIHHFPGMDDPDPCSKKSHRVGIYSPERKNGGERRGKEWKRWRKFQLGEDLKQMMLNGGVLLLCFIHNHAIVVVHSSCGVVRLQED